MSVCDAFATTTPRPYQRTLTPEQALAELCRCAGSQFDPTVVEAFCVLALEPPEPGSAAAPTADRPHAHERG